MSLTKKIWYIQVDQKEEGPYSYLDLEKDARLTTQTLVWREGFENWLPILQVPELKGLFPKKKKPHPKFESESLQPDDQIVLDYQKGPKDYLWILILLTLLVSYLLLWN